VTEICFEYRKSQLTNRPLVFCVQEHLYVTMFDAMHGHINDGRNVTNYAF